MQGSDVDSADALIIIDPQNDFCPGGALAVAGGHEIMPGINELAERFPLVVLTQDWHPREHRSFASSHPGAAPFSITRMPYGPQVLWPDHCVQGTTGAGFHPDIVDGALTRAQLVLRKGCNRDVDSYSAFFENDRTTPTGLIGYLRERGVKRCIFVGLAYDFCVAYSALDAVRAGLGAIVVRKLTRAIAMPVAEGRNSVHLAEDSFREAGVEVRG